MGQLFLIANLFMKFHNCNYIFVTEAQTERWTDKPKVKTLGA